MALIRNKFVNPKTGAEYEWHRNHSEEDPLEKRRDMTRGGTTAQTGLVRIQGEQSPYVMRLKGTIVHAEQDAMFWALWQLCETQTVYFTDFHEQEYEVLITRYAPTRTRVLRNPHDESMPHHIIKYELELEVVRFITGILDFWGVSP